MKKLSLFVTALFSCVLVYGQTFTNVISGSGIPVDRTWVHGVLDYNKDGFEDLLLSLGTSMPNDWNKRVLKIYKNNGNGTFSDQTTQAGLPQIDSIATFVGIADFDNDGFKDIIAVEANNRIRIMCGSSTGVIQDKTSLSGMSLSNVSEFNSPKLGDLDSDGLIDLVGYTGSGTNVRRVGFVKNKFNMGGPAGGFTPILPDFPSNYEPTFQLFDYDSDNDLDFFLLHFKTDEPWPGGGYYYHPIKTYRNNGGAFTEVPTISPIKFAAIGFYPNISDYNQDGKFDIFSGKGDYSPNSSLFIPSLKNNGNGSFSDVSTVLNFSSGSCYQSPPIENDFDLDGDLDYYQGSSGFGGCNGSWFFQNNNGAFAEVSNSIGVRINTGPDPNGATGHPAANFFDFDNDGDLDFFGSSANWGSNTSISSFMRNNQTFSNKWLKVDLIGCQSGKDGYYSSLMVKASNKKFYRIKYPFKGDGWAQSQLIHFGLSNASTIDSVVVKWPSGQTTILTNVQVNQTLTVNEDNNCNAVSANCPDLSGSLLQGLVGYWPFCGNANDESGNGNNGITNQMVWGTDRFGNPNSAAEYNGNYQRAIRVPNPVGATGGEFTFSFWLKASGPLSIYNGIIDAKGSGMYCQMYGPLSQYVNAGIYGKLGFSGYLGNNESSSTVNDSLWHHGVMVVNWTAGNVKIYIDGNLNATRTFAPQTINPWTAIDIGNSFDVINNPAAAGEGIFGGSLDDIAIWNRALSQQEITQLYNQGICQTSITVTDTLLIHTGITTYNPVAFGNTLKVWPNPGNQDITMDAGNLSSMQGWKYKVANGLGQTVVNETAISQQQTNISLSTWGGNGIYYLHLINPQGIAVEIKKIVLAP